MRTATLLFRVPFGLLLGVSLFAACGGSSSYDINAPTDGDGGSSDGGASGDGGKSHDGGGGDSGTSGDDASLAPPGTCAFHASGAVLGDCKGAGFARMNGGGNLIIECGMFDGAAAETLELDVGNGTYAGPADYTIDASGGGSVTYQLDAKRSFDTFSGDFSTVCKVTIASAPATSFAPPGSKIAGTFACMGLMSSTNNDGGKDLENLSAGAFNVVIR